MRESAVPGLAVVIPTLDEAGHLPRLLGDLRRLKGPVEIVVADGGSGDATVALARAAGARVVRTAPGRARQLRAGARSSAAPWLFFVHADCRLDARAAQALGEHLACPEPAPTAHFGFALEGDHWFWRFIEFGQRLRERWLGLAYGDQGLLVSREAYEAVGGFPRWALMEDVGILDRLRRHGPVRRLDADLLTSPRRYRAEGRWLAWLRNASLMTLYRAGVPVRFLARAYARNDRPSPGPGCLGDTLIVFAKAPRPGEVKTRLAADVGAARAADIYRALGRRVVNRVKGGPYRTVVYFDPPDAESELTAWLGSDLEYQPQDPGSLGERMASAFARELCRAHRVCIVGTDAPDVDSHLVVQALEGLTESDVVVGPAADGGYYLMALSRTRPELFRDVPWSTSQVLARTLEKARSTGLQEYLLPTLRDVDTAADLPRELLF